MVFVDWCRAGEELVLLDIVRDFCGKPNATVIATKDMLLGDFLQWHGWARQSAAWSHGKWFSRNKGAMTVFRPQREGGKRRRRSGRAGKERRPVHRNGLQRVAA